LDVLGQYENQVQTSQADQHIPYFKIIETIRKVPGQDIDLIGVK